MACRIRTNTAFCSRTDTDTLPIHGAGVARDDVAREMKRRPGNVFESRGGTVSLVGISGIG